MLAAKKGAKSALGGYDMATTASIGVSVASIHHNNKLIINNKFKRQSSMKPDYNSANKHYFNGWYVLPPQTILSKRVCSFFW